MFLKCCHWKRTKLVQYVSCAVLDIWEDGCGFAQWVWKRVIWTIYLSGWRERIYRQVLLDLCVVHVLFGHEFPENFSRPLMYVAATSKRRSNVKPQIIILTSLSWQTGIRLDSWVLPGVMPLYQDRGRSSFPRSRPRSLAILMASLRKIMLLWYLECWVTSYRGVEMG